MSTNNRSGPAAAGHDAPIAYPYGQDGQDADAGRGGHGGDCAYAAGPGWHDGNSAPSAHEAGSAGQARTVGGTERHDAAASPRAGVADGAGVSSLSSPAPRQGSIVPSANVAGRALVFVVAIMTFLACLTQGTASLLRGSAQLWASQVSAEATIQIKPTETADMERALETARAFALAVDGVTAARIIDEAGAEDLLAPWLGEGLSLEGLPVPRLIEVRVDPDDLPDFGAMRSGLSVAVPGAILDDHRTWVDRLVMMARAAIVAGTALLALVLGATALTVVFATRGAMVGNRHIIEVLHFVGAEPRFVANEFERHFLKVGAKGALAGCVAAIATFLVGGLLLAPNAPDGTEAALFGTARLGPWGYAGMVLIAGLVALITSLTTGATVRRTLDEMDEARGMGNVS